MKRILMTVIVMMMAMMLLCCAAMAEEIALSPGLAAQKLAIAALHDKYGVTRDSLGLFSVDVTEESGSILVYFRPDNFLPVERIGEYVIRVAGGEAEASWTHDDKDAALWQSGDPESPVWGEKLLQLCLSNDTSWMVPYCIDDPERLNPPVVYDHFDFERYFSEASTLPPTAAEDALDLPQARKLADAALMTVYAMTAEEVAALDHDMDAYYLLCADGRILWEVTLADSERCYIVLIDAVTEEVFHITLVTGGNG